MIRIGIGHDRHRLAEDRPLILGGVTVPFERGLAGHSDADIVLHALTDAILGAAALGDIGDLFPDTDPANKDRASADFLSEALARLHRAGWHIVNIDLILFAEKPKLGPVKQEIRANVARLLEMPVDAVSVKAKTGEKVGVVGRGEAMECMAAVLIEK